MGQAEFTCAIAWIRRQEYAEIRAIMADHWSFPEHYAAWRLGAETAERACIEDGGNPVRIEIRPRAFISWCDDGMREMDNESRRAYVDEMLRLGA